MKPVKPTTPGLRNRILEDFSVLTKKQPEKSLLVSYRQKAGRNNAGRITSRHRGGGVKKLYRMVEFGEPILDKKAVVKAVEYDPYRTAFIALLDFGQDGKQYVLASQNMKVGDEITVGQSGEIKSGNRLKLKNIPVGTNVFNIEINPGQGGKMIRAAGSFATVLANEGIYTHLKMASGEIRMINQECFATIGMLSRPEHKYINLGKAGRSRWLGRRPHVRGTAMNPCDHPHGGGEGRCPIGMPGPKTPWGKPARGVKTRNRQNTEKFIIQRRKK